MGNLESESSAGALRPRWSYLCLGALLALAPPLVASSSSNVEFEHLTTEDGLAHSSVWDVLQDRHGFLWFATAGSLQRYDGYELISYQHDPDDPDSIAAAQILKIFEDRHGILWLGTRSEGLDRLDPSTGRFQHFRPAADDGLADGRVRSIYEDHSGVLWLGSYGGLHRWHPEDGSFTNYLPDPDDPDSIGTGTVSAMLEDRYGDFWVGSGSGLHLFDRSAGSFRHFVYDADDPSSLPGGGVNEIYEDPSGELWIGTDWGLARFERERAAFVRYALSPGNVNVVELLEDADGELWIGTYGDGVFRTDRSANGQDPSGQGERFVHFVADPQDRTRLGSNRVHGFWLDRSGILWIAHRSGVDKYDRRRERFVKYRQETGELAGKQVWSVLEDRSGVLWISALDGGLTALEGHGPKRSVISHYRHEPESSQSLAKSQTTALLEDRYGELWIGHMFGGLSRLDRERRRVTRYPPETTSLDNGTVATLLEDRSGTVWIGLLGDGVQRYDRPRDAFVSYEHDPEDPSSLGPESVYALHEDRAGDLWIGGYGGVSRFDPDTGEFDRIVHDPANRNSLSHNDVSSIREDDDGFLWIGTMGGGLNRWDRARDEFRHYRIKDGLPSDAVVGIVEDEGGRLWLATDQGLACLDPRSGELRAYDVQDGLHGNTFFIGPAYRTRAGELFFGGDGGVTAFYPDAVVDDPVAPEVVITELLLDGAPVSRQGLDPASPFAKPANEISELVLSHHYKTFSLEFAGLHFATPDKNRYAFRLEGYDDWVESGARHRRARYTNLDPGSYRFQVRSANRDGEWSAAKSIGIRVLPPPWETWWAYGLYVLIGSALIATYLRSQRAKLERERQIAERERAASRRLQEADRLKDEFLANTSHELRTPLYGITGLAESLIDGAAGELPDAARSHLAMLVASGRRLTSLVNDILDFSKLKHRSLALERRPVDLRSVSEVVLALSHPLVGSKELRLVNAVPVDLPPADADEDRLQQILHNLVGNALKFTEAGTVEVGAEVFGDGGKEIVVRVTDTGLGIAEDEQERIFRAFEQADASIERRHGGTGLGLAITRRLVELHGGRLWLESTPEEGSAFFFSLPRFAGEVPVGTVSAGAVPVGTRPVGLPVAPHEIAEVAVPDTAPSPPSSSADVLIVDDEPVVRQVLVNHLATSGYRLRQAANGVEALERIEERLPDLVLLDVMMPRMSGYELCRNLRQHHTLDELPVIFLTAKSQPSDLVVGLAAGANDYLAKPITKSELLARVKTHLDLLDVHRQLSLLVDERTSQLHEREQLLNERGRLIDQLNRRNAELARFNYTLAHDLKNPLTTIKNFVGLVAHDAEKGDHDRLRHNLEQVDTAADRLHLLIEELYEFSRIERPLGPPVAVPVGKLVEKARSELADDIARHRVEVETAPNLPVVRGDREQLQKLFVQLLRNAVHYLGDQKRPRIEIGVRDRESGPLIYVRDNGLGIDPRYHEKIFELFERLDPDDPYSTGVGLALVKRIVEAHDGEVWVESEGVGSGSTFCVSLPVVE